MFDLESELAKWRKSMAAVGLQNPAIIRELEEHLREDIQQQIQAGTPMEAAMRAALERMGHPSALRDEFALSRQMGLGEFLRGHRWKIFLCTGCGLLAAVILQLIHPSPYQSNAKLFLRFAATAAMNEEELRERDSVRYAPAGQVESIVGSELEILASFEMARRVAEAIGPQKLVANAGDGDPLDQAAAVIQRGLFVQNPSKSSVVRLAFRHPDPNLSQPVLRAVIDCYLKMHVEKHRAMGSLFQIADGRISNISQIQAPSPPLFDFASSAWMLSMIVSAGILAGVVWVSVSRWNSQRPPPSLS